MAVQAGILQQLVTLVHEKGVQYRNRQLDMTKVTWTGKVRKMACFTSFDCISIVSKPHRVRSAYTSRAVMGPNFGSYNPPRVGRFRLSSKIGLSIFLTEMERISSVVKEEKDMAVISVERGWAMSIMALFSPAWRGRKPQESRQAAQSGAE